MNSVSHRLLATVCSAIFYSCIGGASLVFADQPLNIEFAGSDSDDPSPLVKSIRQSDRLSDFVEMIDQEIIFEKKLSIKFGADDGPLFDPHAWEILMPDSFTDEIADRFSAGSVTDDTDELQTYVEDVLLHTLVHEIGHALIEMYNLPVLGKEEDAVDGLATVFLLEFYDDGAAIALSAADMFALESEDREELNDAYFWDEHSLDEQRFYSVLCHVYGSDPDQYGELVGENGIGEERADLCVFEYQKLTDDWFYLLEPYRP